MCRLQAHLCLNTQSLSLLPLSSPSLRMFHSLSLFFSLTRSLFGSFFADTSTFMLLRTEMGVCERVFMRSARTPRGLRARFMRVRATTLVRAVKFINVTRTHLSVVLGRYLYVRGTSRASYIDEYRQIYFLSLFFIW